MNRVRLTPLLEAATDHPLRLGQVVAIGDLARRLDDLGLRTGGRISILVHRRDGGVVIRSGTARLAVSADVARKLLVTDEEGEA